VQHVDDGQVQGARVQVEALDVAHFAVFDGLDGFIAGASGALDVNRAPLAVVPRLSQCLADRLPEFLGSHTGIVEKFCYRRRHVSSSELTRLETKS
jgi:hypothetical protein